MFVLAILEIKISNLLHEDIPHEADPQLGQLTVLDGISLRTVSSLPWTVLSS